MSYAKLAILAPLAAMVSGAGGLAQDGAYKEVRGWSIYRNEANCSAYMMFENGEALGFAYDAPGRSMRLTFTDGDADALKDASNVSLDVLLRYPDRSVDHALEATVFMVTIDDEGHRTLASRWLGPPALDGFKNATILGLYDSQRQIGLFNLKGTAAALQEVERCAAGL